MTTNRSRRSTNSYQTKGLILGLLFLITVLVIGFFVVKQISLSIRSDVNTAEASINSVFTHASTVNPYREVIDYYQSVVTPTASANDQAMAAMIEAAMDDGMLSVQELKDIREVRKTHLESAAKASLFNGELGLPAPSMITYDPINAASETRGIYQDLLNYKAAAEDMGETDRVTLLNQIDAAATDGVISEEEHRDIKITFNNIDEALDKQRLIEIIAQKPNGLSSQIQPN